MVVLLAACQREPEPEANGPAPEASAATSGELTAAATAAADAPPAPAEASRGTAEAPLPSASAVNPLLITLAQEPVARRAGEPFVFTAAFDGSMRFSLWLRLLEHARAMGAKYGQKPHYTFFVNACYYTAEKVESDVGRAMTRDEVLVRRALTQQAINEGHDIGDHGMGHHDGRLWDKSQWLAELDRFHQVMDFALFQPVLAGEPARPVFPVFEPLAGASAGALGAACAGPSDCSSGLCAALTETTSVCSAPCNLHQKCPKGTACGAPMFRKDTDLCIVVPKFPVELDGKRLFDARGEPNLKHPRLVRYRIEGFRAPYLAANDALYDALSERGYRYDTSQSAGPGLPTLITPANEKKRILELPLVLHPGAAVLPMDYNYADRKVSPERMEADYRAAIAASINRGNEPWNVGHHFALWNEGAYFDVLLRTVEHVLDGCKVDGKATCPGARVLSFRELANELL